MKSNALPSIGSLTLLLTIVVLAAASQRLQAQDRAARAAAPASLAGTVKSRDGTTIAYEQSGKGPALVLVSGALSDRSGGARLAALLAPSFTVINFDRRGRGESGDAKQYSVEREIEDIEALIDKSGGAAFVFGSSSGAVLALEAATRLGAKVKAAVLFEPPFIVDASRPPVSEDLFREIGALVAAGRRGDAVAAFMTKAVGVPEEMVAGMKQSPMWAGMELRAHTLTYDGAVMAGLMGGKPLPATRWKAASARTLVIDGERSDAFLRNAAGALAAVLPASKRQTLPGQDHSVVFTAPEALAPVLIDFFLAGKPAGTQKE